MLSCHLVVINSTCVYVHSSPTDARSYTFIYIERKQSTTTLGFHICLCPVQASAAALIFSLSCFPFLPSTLHFFSCNKVFTLLLILTLLLCVHRMKGCFSGPPLMTQVRLSVEPLLRKTSRGPRIVVLGSEKSSGEKKEEKKLLA